MTKESEPIELSIGYDPERTPGQETAEAVLNRCLAEGMEPPFVVIICTASGEITVIRYSQEAGVWRSESLMAAQQNTLPKGYALHMFVIDANDQNRAVRIEHKPAGTA